MSPEHLYLQVNYLRQVSGSLSMFRDRGNNVFNLRCPYCGDSAKSRTKARGYMFRSPKDGLLHYVCHNCNRGASFTGFLKHVDPSLHGRYVFEVFKRSPTVATESVMKVDRAEGLKRSLNDASNYACVTDLSRLHPVNEYVNGRGIPKEKLSELFYTEDFSSFCTSLGNYSDVPSDPRLMLFETDIFGNIKLIIGRSLEKRPKQRYATLRLAEDYPKIYGLSKASKDKRCYVVEGPIDSLFLDNAVASMDANLNAEYVCGEFKQPVFVLDNEPRSPIIVRKLERLIAKGLSVVVFDSNNPYKDVNDMVNGGIEVNTYFNKRTFSGVRAKLEVAKWKRV